MAHFDSEAASERAVVATASDDEPTAIPGTRAVLRIATREYRIAVRSRWALGLTLLFAIFSVAIVGFGTSEVGPNQYAAVVASLVELGVYLVPLAALTVGYDTVVGAREAGSLDMLFTLPVSQAQVIVGKYLGRFTVLGGAMGIGLGIGGVAATLIGGVGGLGQYALFVLVSIVTAGVFLSVSVLLSTIAREKTQALGGALVAWLWFVLLHDLVAIGLIAGTTLPGGALTVMALTNPADVFRLLVLSQLETTTGGFAAILTEASLSVPVLVVALLVWLVAPLVVATVGIRHRPP
ncbi:ABC transporter permease [Haloplanus aerogenes]|uniref:ABC transporter permease n=1 Tax=Haloplanus aerogenes TaxID=660522 RepID=A0A3M0CW87_9EURY|nr:ABC transporter permease [Haloplanus aerogenes]AZH25959.1 ABC transporter permease [Haloplanus aerogenes]RMB11656.1 Cu-processing system permease protein [Haloplanus aerogenes]